MNNIVLYSTGCPRCGVLEKKLKQKGIKYIIIDDIDKMLRVGIEEVPVLQLESGNRFNFKEAIEWINSQGG